MAQKVQQALQAANALRVARGPALGQMRRGQKTGGVQLVGAVLDLKGFAQMCQALLLLGQFRLDMFEGVIHDPPPLHR